jgi:hypothetical protein
VNGLEIGAALTGAAALVTAVFGGMAQWRQAGRDDVRRDREIEDRIRAILGEREDE